MKYPRYLPLCLSLLVALTVSPLVAEEKATDESKEPKEKKFYDPVKKQVEGWTILVDPKLLNGAGKETGDKALVALANHLQRVKYIVPEDHVKELQKLPIWLELHNKVLGAMQYHPSQGWLKAHSHDPRLVKLLEERAASGMGGHGLPSHDEHWMVIEDEVEQGRLS